MVRVPIWLIVGFLGSGKTTLLRRLAGCGRRLVFVVNEFSSVDVDAGRVAGEGACAVGLAGGSVFCRCMASRLHATLEELHLRFWSDVDTVGQGGHEGVVVECSGLADPRAAAELLRETKLDEKFKIAGVIAVVDPLAAEKLASVLPVFKGQIEAASLVLVNKRDQVPVERLEAAVAWVRRIQPSARVVPCAFCRDGVSVEELLSSRPQRTLANPLATARNPAIDDGVFTLRSPVRTEALTGLLKALDAIEGLHRVKGRIATGSGTLELDWTLGGGSLRPVTGEPTRRCESLVVAIGSSLAVEAAGHVLRALEGAPADVDVPVS